MDNVFFCNSGAEANEAAIKLARLYGHKKNVLNPTIVVTEGSFHGRTLATLSATGNRKIQAGFEPLVAGFNRVPYNDLGAVRAVAEHNKDIVAGAGRAHRRRRRREHSRCRLPRRPAQNLRRARLAADPRARFKAAWAAPANGSRGSTKTRARP